MMDYPLTLTPLLDRARRLFPNKEIVTKAGPTLERYTYGQMAERVGRLANALEKLGVRRGDRVATFAWNNARHLELYFAVIRGRILTRMMPLACATRRARPAIRKALSIHTDRSICTAWV